MVRCDWCGVPCEEEDLGWGGVATCSQGCHEHRKQALGKRAGMGIGYPHPLVEPADPLRWPGYAERRSMRQSRARSGGLQMHANTQTSLSQTQTVQSIG